MMKEILLEKIRVELRMRLERLARAAMDAHSAATDPGSKAEGKYDTRSLEASYLAAGQARQVDDMAAALRVFEAMEVAHFSMDDAIEAGALVEVELEGESVFLLCVPTAGGMVVEHEGVEVTLVSPESVLYQKLLGLRVGDVLDEPNLMVLEVG